MIDAGSRDIAAGVLEQVRSHGWELKKLFLTHSHADHVAGAAFLREQTGCEVCAPGISAAAVEHSFLIPVTLYGGSTTPEMCSRLLTPPPCACSELSGDALPPGLDFERLDGHDMAQAAFRTRDGVWFTADAVVSAATCRSTVSRSCIRRSSTVSPSRGSAGSAGSCSFPPTTFPARISRRWFGRTSPL